MSKLKPERISATDLSEYLKSHSDFSFELAVLKMLRESGVECEHGGHYQDPVTNKSREFDIRTIKTIGNFRIRMAVECKNIRKNFPLLVSCIPRHKQDSYHQIAVVGEPEKDSYLAGMHMFQSRAKTLSIRGDYSLYKPSELVGKSTVQVGRRTNDGEISANDSEIYEKWGQCINSADDLVGCIYCDGEDDKKSYLSTVIPFVVVPNDRLWTASYDNDGKLIRSPEPTDRCPCFIGKDYEMGDGLVRVQMKLSHVEIVTFDGMRTFVEDHLKTKTGMTKIFPKEGILNAFDAQTKT